MLFNVEQQKKEETRKQIKCIQSSCFFDPGTFVLLMQDLKKLFTLFHLRIFLA